MDEYYAVYQSGFCIYGVGITPGAAIEDAQEWLDDGDKGTAPGYITRYGLHGPTGSGEIHGEIYLRPCSPALAREVKTVGGQRTFKLDASGILRLEENEHAES